MFKDISIADTRNIEPFFMVVLSKNRTSTFIVRGQMRKYYGSDAYSFS